MLIEKYGEVRFQVKDPKTGGAREIDPAAYLTPQQERMMSTQPDMILWFAHWLAQRWRADGAEAVEVHAISQVSLNGRPSQPLVDPAVDLASVGSGRLCANWILPLGQ